MRPNPDILTAKEILLRWAEAFGRKDVDAVMEFYADDAVNHQSPEAPLHGKDAIRKSTEIFFSLFSDEQTEMVNIMEDGEWAAWEWRGWSPRDETKTVLYGCGFFRVVNAKIVMQRGYWDKATFERGHAFLTAG